MKILHYSLGFPPYRTGGLTKYCIDLMMTQKEMGHDVSMMWPGKFHLSGHFVRIKSKVLKSGIDSFEVINPLPVPLDEGIVHCDEFMRKCPNPQVFVKFLKAYKPDVIHVHTLMGLYKELLEEAKKLGIRIVFTSHDYFGICPKVTLFRNGKVCDGGCENCAACNESALSLTKIKILQSGVYRKLKETKIVKKLRASHRKEFFDPVSEEESRESLKVDVTVMEKYERLRSFYLSIFELVDKIHFNSTVTESIYRKFLPNQVKGRVIHITHRAISDNRKIKEFDSDVLRITYLAPAKPFKGYGILKEALDGLWKEGERRFKLTMYNEGAKDREYISVRSGFEQEMLGQMFEETDVLIAPSACKETYGFTVLEALSYGVPVIVSENVGAKDLLENGKYGMIVEPSTEMVRAAIEKLIKNRKLLEEYNRNIVKEMNLEKIIKSSETVIELYEE